MLLYLFDILTLVFLWLNNNVSLVIEKLRDVMGHSLEVFHDRAVGTDTAAQACSYTAFEMNRSGPNSGLAERQTKAEEQPVLRLKGH